jgi:hypothetical protein
MIQINPEQIVHETLWRGESIIKKGGELVRWLKV